MPELNARTENQVGARGVFNRYHQGGEMSGKAKSHRVVGINGGPRKKWNTALLLEECLKGAAEAGAATELVHLYDLDYKGCVSCFHCKTREHYLEGRCARRDGLSPVLELLEDSTAVVMGSPIYISDVTGALRSFLERYVFINLAYDLDSPSVIEAGPAVGLIYTMGVPETVLEKWGYEAIFATHRASLKRLNGPFIEQIKCCDTLQFGDYSRYHAPMFDEELKKKGRAERFPGFLEKARALGARLGSVK